MLKVWNVSLVLATGILAVLGTFVVRSGILSSIHAFGASTLGHSLRDCSSSSMIAGSIALVVTRAAELRSEHRLDSLLSREAVFLLNNLVLVGLCFVIFWGTFFPLISEAVTGDQASRRAAVVRPLHGAARACARAAVGGRTGLGAGGAPRRPTSGERCAGRSPRPASCSSCCSRPAASPIGPRRWSCSASRRSCSRSSVRSSGAACAPGARCRATRCRARSSRSCGRNRRRYGGYLVHAGVALLFVGSPPRRRSRTRATCASRRASGTRVGGYDVTYVRPTGKLDVASQRLAREDRPRRRAARAPRRRRDRDAPHRAQLLPVQRPSLGAGVALLRGRGDQRGRPPGRPAPRPVDGGRARHRRRSRRSPTRATACSDGATALPADERAAALGEALRRLVAAIAASVRPPRSACSSRRS